MLPILLVFLLMAVIGGGVNSSLVKIGIQEFPPLTLTFLRFFFALLIIFPIWLRQKEYIHPKDLYKVLPLSLNVMLFSVSIQYTTVIVSSAFYNLVPIVVAVIGYLFLREKLTKNQIIGLVISVIGVGILFKGTFETKDVLSFGTPLGNMLMLFTITCFSFYPVFGRSLGKKYSQKTILFFSFLLTCLLLLFIVPFEWTIRPIMLSKVTSSGIISVFGLAVLSSVVYYFLYQWLINRTSAFVSSLTQYSQFAFAIVFGILFFHEHVTQMLALGIFLALSGVFLATTYQTIQKHRRSKAVLQ